MPPEIQQQPGNPVTAGSGAAAPIAGAPPKNTPIDANVFQNLLFPLTKDILKDFLGNAPEGQKNKPVLSNYLDQGKSTDMDRSAFEEAYFRPKEATYKEYTAARSFNEFRQDPSFRTLFREAFIETYKRKRALSGKAAADLLYAPDEKGVFSSETERRILYLTYEIVQSIQDLKIKNETANGKTPETQVQLSNGKLLLFVNKNTRAVVSLTEEEARKPENKDLIPYIPLNLRDKATGENIPTSDPIGRAFAQERAAAAERLLEEQGLKIVEPFSVDANGEIKGKVMGTGKDKNLPGPTMDVKVRPNLQPGLDPRDPNQLRFDFKFDNKNNIDASCPDAFFLYSGDLNRFKDAEGIPRPADAVAKEALEHNGPPTEYAPASQIHGQGTPGFTVTDHQARPVMGGVEGGGPRFAAAPPRLEPLVTPPEKQEQPVLITTRHPAEPPTTRTEESAAFYEGASSYAATTQERKRQQQLAQQQQQQGGQQPVGGRPRYVEPQPVAANKPDNRGKVAAAVGGGSAVAYGAWSVLDGATCTKPVAQCATLLADKVADIVHLISHVAGKFHF